MLVFDVIGGKYALGGTGSWCSQNRSVQHRSVEESGRVTDREVDAEGGSGRCLCGGVRYGVTGALRPVIDCHCVRCRRFTGHHMAATSAATADVDIIDSDQCLAWFSVPGAAYGFCRSCGSSLFWRSDVTPDRLSICAGTLASPTHLRTVEAWWVSQASDYHRRPDLPERPTE
jgi:hypothetical protein